MNVIDISKESSEEPIGDLHTKLDGVLEIGRSTIQIAFPVPRSITDGPIRTVDIYTKHPGELFSHIIPVFATSFINYGATRALALLVKQHCSGSSLEDGICWVPCFNRGWRQRCRVGTSFKSHGCYEIESSSQKRVDVQRNVLCNSTEPQSDDIVVEPIDNVLERVSGYCSLTLNPAIQLARLREMCAEVQLNSTITSDVERMSIKGCNEVRFRKKKTP